MKAYQVSAPSSMQEVDIPTPQPQKGEYLIKVDVVGICGSDLHFYDGSSPVDYPQVLGHEIVGTIAAGNDAAAAFSVGDSVIVEPTIACGSCFACRSGKYNCCPRMEMIGVTKQGGFAEYITAPKNYLYKRPASLPLLHAALAEPFSIGAQIISRLGSIKHLDYITLIGAGPIGITVLHQLRPLFDGKIIVVDLQSSRLEKAAKHGADFTINPQSQALPDAISAITEGEGSHAVIECAGAAKTISLAVDIVSDGGVVVVAGVTFDEVSIMGRHFTKKEIEIRGSRNNSGKMPEVIAFLDQNPDLAEEYISEIHPLSEVESCIHLARERPDRINKILLEAE